MTQSAATGEERHPEPQGRLLSTGFLALVATQFLGAFNDNMFRWLAVPIAQQTLGTTAAVSWGGLALTLPYLLFTPTGGWLADRFSKRSVILACKIAEIVLALLAAGSIATGSVALLFAVVGLLGAQSALFGPAKFGTIPEILPSSLLAKGNGVMSLCTIVAVALGTVAGFALYDWARPVLANASLASVLTCGAALAGVAVAGTLTSLFISRHPAADPQRKPALNPLTDAIPAIKLLAADPPLMKTALGIAFFFLLASLSQLNIDPFGETILGLDKTDVGILLAILVIGVGAGSVLAGLWSAGHVELGISPLGAVGIVVSATAVFLCGSMVQPELPPKEQFAYYGSCVSLFLLGMSAGLYDVPLEAYLQYRSPPKQRGTVLAGSYFIAYALIVVSCGLFYLLHGVLGLSAAEIFLIAGLGTIPVAWYIISVMPALAFRFLLWLLVHTLYRVQVFGEENIPRRGGAVIVPNHVSWADGVVLITSSQRLIRFLVYADLTHMPFLRELARLYRVIPVKSEASPRELILALRTAREAALNGDLVCIFPEGALTRTGQLQTFQRGVLRIVDKTDIPVIPTHLHGMWGSVFSYWKGKFFWKWPRRWPYPVEIRFGEPIVRPKEVNDVRRAIELLSTEAYEMDARSRLIPARTFIRNCKRGRRRPCLADSGGTSLNGGKTLAAALAFQRVLRRSVLADDEKNVGLLVPPTVGGALANAAVALCGRTAVNLNYTLTPELLNFCINKAGIRHVITSKAFLEKKPYELEGAEFVFLEDLKQQVRAGDKLLAGLQTYLVPPVILDRLLGLHRIDPDSPLTVVFTSGSTGEPKGVVLSHTNIGANIEAIEQLLQFDEHDGLLGVLPFFHSFGYTASMWLPLCYPVRGVYHFNPLDAKTVGRLVQEHRLTILMATPTFLRMYLRRCEKEQFQTLDTVIVGAEKLPSDLALQFQEKFGVLPSEGYGTTELSPVAAVNVPDHRSGGLYQPGTKLGSVGRPIPGVTAKVVDPETLKELGVGAEGLLLIKGPNVMKGYLDDPAKTAAVVLDGWYNTGDLANIDNDGFITITGRQSRFSKIGGEMVPHLRIEEELVRICEDHNDEDHGPLLVVTAVPDPARGERLVVLHRQLCKSPEQVVKELASKGLPNLFLPDARSFYQVESIPLLGTGKLDLRAVKELALQVTGEKA